MSAGQRRSAARTCGQVIACLHSVPVSGFYRRHGDGSFEFADNAALQAADLANRLDNLRLLAGAGLLTQAEAHRAEGLLPEAVAACGDGPAVLCHGELFPGHIFVAAGEDEAVTVTGLIDFGDACGGRPLDDLALLCWEWPAVDRAALAAGYGPAPFWTDQGRRLALGQLRILIGYTAHDLRAGQPPVPRVTWPGLKPCSPPRPCEIVHNALVRIDGFRHERAHAGGFSRHHGVPGAPETSAETRTPTRLTRIG